MLGDVGCGGHISLIAPTCVFMDSRGIFSRLAALARKELQQTTSPWGCLWYIYRSIFNICQSWLVCLSTGCDICCLSVDILHHPTVWNVSFRPVLTPHRDHSVTRVPKKTSLTWCWSLIGQNQITDELLQQSVLRASFICLWNIQHFVT